jgi:glycosyltransferase involved in cell wall biosynthesis
MPDAIIIPAHNESSVIGRNLAVLIDGLPPSVAVIVVCNGCTDDTASIVRSIHGRIQVLELDIASKTAALNAGDAETREGARLYLDADVRLSGPDAADLLEKVSEDAVLAAEPGVQFDVSSSSVPVRGFYAVWVALHGSRPGDIGGGAIALSRSGRRRFGVFPDVTADDGFVRAHFSEGEIARTEAISRVTAPRTTADLVRIKARSRFGNTELQEAFPDLWAGKRRRGEPLWRKVMRLPPRLWIQVPFYVAVQGRARARALRMCRSATVVWERDEGSRT